MKKSILFICLLTLASTLAKVQAQEERNHGIIWSSLHGLEYGVKAGFNIGGTSPLPLPQEIRAITGYSPNVCFAIEGNVTKWFDKDKKICVFASHVHYDHFKMKIFTWAEEYENIHYILSPYSPRTLQISFVFFEAFLL